MDLLLSQQATSYKPCHAHAERVGLLLSQQAALQKQVDAARSAAHAAGDKEANMASLHRRDLEALAAVQQQLEVLQQQQPKLASTQVCRGMHVKERWRDGVRVAS